MRDNEKGEGKRPLISQDQSGADVQFRASLCELSPTGIYVVQDGRFRFVNPECATITGYPEDEMLGLSAISLVPSVDVALVRQSAIEMLKGERTAPYEHRIITKAGKTRWVLTGVRAIEYQGRRATLGNVIDITDRERARESLRITEEKFYKVFRSSPDWVLITTIDDGFHVDVNEAFLHSTGYRRDEVIGRTAAELGVWADPEERTEMVKRLREEGAVRNMEVTFRMKSGGTRTVLWSAELIDFGGEKCLVGIGDDISERKRAEEERIQRERQKGPATLITQLGLTMAGSILLCFAIGYYLDKWLDTKGIFITIFILLGIAGGGYNAYRQIMETMRLNGRDKFDDKGE